LKRIPDFEFISLKKKALLWVKCRLAFGKDSLGVLHVDIQKYYILTTTITHRVYVC